MRETPAGFSHWAMDLRRDWLMRNFNEERDDETNDDGDQEPYENDGCAS